MTIAMPDDINVNLLPAGYPAYLGYVDGEYQTATVLRGLFPAAKLVLLTVTGNTTDCDGCDIEPGNLDAAGGARWAVSKLAADPGSRPVLYASILGQPGYGMGDVIRYLDVAGVGTGLVRLLSAHYGEGPHVCGPFSCRMTSYELDGTQWTNAFATGAGANIDMSMLADDFFGPVSETEVLVQQLGTVQQGSTGGAVRTVQGLCVARGVTGLAVDGVFGQQTFSAVARLQAIAKVTADGIVGPQTWPVLLGVA